MANLEGEVFEETVGEGFGLSVFGPRKLQDIPMNMIFEEHNDCNSQEYGLRVMSLEGFQTSQGIRINSLRSSHVLDNVLDVRVRMSSMFRDRAVLVCRR